MPLSPETETQSRQLYRALSEEVLQPDDPRYVESILERDLVEELATEIRWSEAGGVCLITGQRGTGKSTQLRRLEKQLDRQGASVFYVDMAEYLLLTKEIEISDFLIQVAGAFSEKIENRYQDSPGKRGYLERLNQFLKTELVLEDMSLSGGGATIQASLKTDEHFKRRLQKALRGHVARIVKDAHDFIAEAVEFVRLKESEEDRTVVLIVDSTERIRGVGKEAMDVFDSVRDLFVGHAENLLLPSVHVVYSIPPYLSALAAGVGGVLGTVPRRFYSVHTFDRFSRKPDQKGLQVMREVIKRRHKEWEALISPRALERLSIASGGDLREFFRLIRHCLASTLDDSQLPLDSEAVDEAEDRARSEMMPISREHLQWLQRIASTGEHGLERDEDLPILARFLDNHLVFVYRNGEDWYDIHPLLRDVVGQNALKEAEDQ